MTMMATDSIDPRGAYEIYPDSNDVAEELFNKYLKSPGIEISQSILVTGNQGIDKSTIKKILKGHIKNINDKKRNIITVDFNAFQFEENGQVTSSFYSTIASSLKTKNWLNRFNKNRGMINDFYAVSYLKKESNQNSLSIGFVLQVLLVGLITYLLVKISKLSWINKLLTHGFIQVPDPVLGNKIILLFIFVGLLYLYRNAILKIIAAKLPRLSHVDILRKINIGNHEMVIFVDEVDRLTAESAKYLLDELLILKDSLNYQDNKNKCTIFVFCDVESVDIKDNPNKTALGYLHKHFDVIHAVNTLSSLPEIVMENICNTYYISYKIFKKYRIGKLCFWISKEFKTFRDVEKLFGRLSHELRYQEIQNMVNKYFQEEEHSKMLFNFIKRYSEQDNEVYLIFMIIAVSEFVKIQAINVHENQIKFDELWNILSDIIFSCYQQQTFNEIRNNLTTINSELAYFKKIHTGVLDITATLSEITGYQRANNLDVTAMKKVLITPELLNKLLANTDNPKLKKRISDLLMINNTITIVQGINSLIQELKLISMYYHNIIRVLQICIDITLPDVKFMLNSTSSEIQDLYSRSEIISNNIDNNFESYIDIKIETKTLLKVIFEEFRFYSEKIDVKSTNDMDDLIKKLLTFIA